MTRAFSMISRPALIFWLALLIAASLCSCNRDVWRTPPEPTPVPTGSPGFSDKLWGRIGSVLVTDVPSDSDESSQLWIGFDSDAQWQHLHGGELGRTSWIGGQVKLNDKAQYGFYFDPQTTTVSNQPEPARQTTIAELRREPQKFTSGIWYLHARVLRRLGPARNWH
jgi:hypothetical protein